MSPGITLPAAFSPTTTESLSAYVTACSDFLTSPLVSSILECHPNDVAVDGPRREWLTWWEWAAGGQAEWKLVIPGWSHDRRDQLPLEIRQLLENVDRLTLPRGIDSHFATPSTDASLQTRGMSPKKSHEVSQMSALLQVLVSDHSPKIKHIVDIGAGQGYLSRALCEYPLHADVLALDFSDVQTDGAKRRGNNIQKEKAKRIPKNTSNTVASDGVLMGADPSTHLHQAREGTLTHETIYVDPQSLYTVVTRWILSQRSPSPSPTPVYFVALHACGTLTPDIFRCFLSCRDQETTQRSWYPAGLVIVGCCYNLMSPTSDFPLSLIVADNNQIDGRRLHLSYNHRSLAAQSPLQWSISDSTRASAELAIRKVVYRALFGKLSALSSPNKSPGSSQEQREHPGKIGRLRDAAYASFPEFVAQANKKTGANASLPIHDGSGVFPELTSCLEVLHALRSRIGPVIESLILVDRWLYLVEHLPDLDVRAVNLFDQQRGSARNVALIVSPRMTPFSL